MDIKLPDFIPDTSWLHMKPSKVAIVKEQAYYQRGVNYFVTYEYMPVGTVFYVSGFPGMKYAVSRDGVFVPNKHLIKHSFVRLDGNPVTSADLNKFKVGKRLLITGKTA